MNALPILTYHRLLPGEATRTVDPQRIAVSAAQFRSHLKWLKRLGYRSFPLDRYPELLRSNQAIPKRRVGITFDDGYEEVLKIGFPILREFGFTATVFAVSGELGGTNRWDDGAAKLLTVEQYRSLHRVGITIGAHTRHHVHLPKLFDPQAREELATSKQELETALGFPVPLLAYPYGETNDRIDGLAKEAGYTAAFATDQAPLRHADNLYRLRRAVVFPSNTTFQILLKAQPWYTRYQDWKRRES
jgi:peptidoglycan/xylan/chitin deacetylase (PgdA/CDA1 family)